MAWVRASLRGKSVYARANDSGALAAAAGRVEVRYQRGDGRRYQAAVANLTVTDATPLPDETCAAAEDVANAPPKRAVRAGASVTAGDRAARAGASNTASGSPKHEGVVAYTDGACSGNPGPAGLGVVLMRGAVTIELSEYLGLATNNVAELTAVLRALEELDADTPASIFTDSQYAIGVVQKGWKAKANTELVAELKQLYARRRATLFYVRGHAGDPLNERADELARDAVTRRTIERHERERER
ncbi:MAG: ribonuclease HI [Myxococcales bacterium]|nr:ribonuclease HI [Myxococcales bacterium]